VDKNYGQIPLPHDYNENAMHLLVQSPRVLYAYWELSPGLKNVFSEKKGVQIRLNAQGFEMIKPRGAFYLFPKSPLPDDVEFIRKAQKYNLLLVPGSGFGKPGYFRMAYCIDKQIILNSLPAFKALAAELGMTR
jgi:hypothetical protein